MTEPENLMLRVLGEMRAEMKSEFAAVRTEMKNEFAEVRSQIGSLRADVASDLVRIEANAARAEKRLIEQIAGLRRGVMEYHSSAIGHGVLLTELEERIMRLEDKVKSLAPDAR